MDTSLRFSLQVMVVLSFTFIGGRLQQHSFVYGIER